MSTGMRRTLSVAFVLVFLLSIHPAAQRDSGVASARYIAVFRNATLPADADARVSRAGGTIVVRMDQVGAVVAVSSQPAFASRLRADAAVLAVDSDRVIEFARPASVASEDFNVSPDNDAPHPFPFAPFPADYFYTSTSQQWAVKRVGAHGGGIPGGGARDRLSDRRRTAGTDPQHQGPAQQAGNAR
jgi:hypothetical protein